LYETLQGPTILPVQLKRGRQAAQPERLCKIVFQANDIQIEVIVFVKFEEFVAVLSATNSSN